MLDFVRGLVRPIITITGWLVFVFLVGLLVRRFATEEMTTLAFQSFLELLGIVVGFWFGQRSVKQ